MEERRKNHEKGGSVKLLELQVGELDKGVSVVLHLVNETKDDSAI